MLTRSLALSIASTVLLTACETQPPKAAPAARSNAQLELKLASGNYRCEQGQRLQVEREMRNQTNTRINIVWNGSSYRLDRDPSYSGLPRFEDRKNGLVWIDLPWKGMLLDGTNGKPLANECRAA